MSTEAAYPLAWPDGWERRPARQRERSRFHGTRRQTSQTGSWTQKTDLSIFDALGRLKEELRRLPAVRMVVSSNVEVRNDGMPRSDRRAPDDPGVAVYFTLVHDKRRCVLACDKWDTVAGNIAAIAAHVDALRGQERWGVGSLERAFTGYTALPPPAPPWWETIGVAQDECLEVVEAVYRARAKRLHSDIVGCTDDGKMAALNLAIEEARRQLGNSAGSNGTQQQ